MPRYAVRLLPMLLAASALCACEVGPNYTRPAAETPPAFKEIQGWTPANPQADAANRADWWTIFNDPVLNGLEEKIATNNYTLAADLAAYEQERALVAEQRAALFPTLTGTGDATASKSAGTRILPSAVMFAVTFATSARVRGDPWRVCYSPVNCGGRLANVAEMPSVRSLDGRNAAFQAAT